MRQNNLGNLGFFRGMHYAGLLGASNARDVDHSIAKFATQEAGIRAAASLALHKYTGGRRNAWDVIAAKGGWTPGSLGPGASVNVARAMGLSNRDDLHLDDEGHMVKFLRGLALQEHGQKAGSWYTEERIRGALHREHPALTPPPSRPPHRPDAPATTVRLEEKMDRMVAAVERGGLHRLHVTADKSLKVAKAYGRGALGVTTG